jgi:hypothetical protein
VLIENGIAIGIDVGSIGDNPDPDYDNDNDNDNDNEKLDSSVKMPCPQAT